MTDTAPPGLPISDHGLIGDLRTAALVCADGTISWFCAPRFDSPSVFGSLVGGDRGGHWSITPTGEGWTARQFYLPDTNVLVTRFADEGGVVEVRDFMAILRPHDPDHRQRLVRIVACVRGAMQLAVEIAPRFGYGLAEHDVVVHPDRAELTAVDLALVVSLPGRHTRDDDGVVRGVLDLEQGDEAAYVLEVMTSPATAAPATPDDAGPLLAGTLAFWRDWLGQCRYRGRWREEVHRSALALKLLTHEPTGAIIAAPTTSLPEVIGGERNWDYRHVWLRDAAFSLYALLRLGFLDEAGAFMRWLMDRIAGADDGPDGPLRSMYDIDGNSTSGERTLDHWPGYRGSRPVRVRNDAADQFQLDVYGELIDSIYLYDKYGDGISYDTWMQLVRLVSWLQENWDRPDEGIWETRAGRRKHTFSRVMSWVAVERMMRISRRRGLPGDLVSWQRTRDDIARAVFDTAWNAELEAFTQSEGSETLDASLLLMPAVKFVSPADPRFRSTLRAIERALVTDTLVYRYVGGERLDGLPGDEGTFSMCSFWYVEALTRTGRLEDARLALEKMFTYASPLGLHAEEIGRDGSQLGNFPQAFTHLSLISAAINLDRALP